MLLYIPTSSLNADSILSCECISPASICRKRTFGYSQFEALKELRQFDNYTLAFSKAPKFTIADNSRENYPMLVEVDIPSIDKCGLEHIGRIFDTDIYATANPIWISPSNTRLLFANPRELDYTYHNCADSAKCKLFDFFKNKKAFAVIGNSQNGASLSSYLDSIYIPESKLTYTFSENDYDKVKGFIWGYGIGSLLSLSPESATLLRIQKRIYDIISAIRSDKFVSDTFKDELDQLDKEYSSYDPAQNEAKSKWNKICYEIASKFGLDKSEIVNYVLRSLDVENEAKSKFLSKQCITLRKNLTAYGSFINYEQYNADLVAHTRSIIFHEKEVRCDNFSFANKLDIDTSEFKNVALSSDDENSILYNKFLFRVVWDRLISSIEEMTINREELARNVVITLKNIIEELGHEWGGSATQLYFDRMRKNISRFEPFNLNDIDNPILKSIAAFTLKGEDFDSLKKYLESNAVADYKYAFALWGAMTGYVSISRALIDSILSRNEKIALYKASYKAIHNEQIDYTIEATVIPSSIANTENHKAGFTQRVLNFFDSLRKYKNTDLLRKGLVETLQKLEESGHIEDGYLLVTSLDNKPGWNKKPKPKAWTHLQEEFCPDYDLQVSGRKSDFNQNSTSQKSSKKKNFIETSMDTIRGLFSINEQSDVSNIATNEQSPDTNLSSKPSTRAYASKISFTLNYIEAITKIIHSINPGLSKSAVEYIKKDLNWVFDPNYSMGKSELELLEIFRMKLYDSKTKKFSNNGKPMEWKNELYHPLDIDKTIEELKKRISL